MDNFENLNSNHHHRKDGDDHLLVDDHTATTSIHYDNDTCILNFWRFEKLTYLLVLILI